MSICNACVVFAPIVAIVGKGHFKKKTDKCEICHEKLLNITVDYNSKL